MRPTIPKTLDEISGQEQAIREIRESVSKRQPPMAYLLHGPRGTGKGTAAGILARALNKAGGRKTGLTATAITDTPDMSGRLKAFRPSDPGRAYNALILRGVDKLEPAEAEELAEIIDNLPARTIAIMTATSLSKTSKALSGKSLKVKFGKIPTETIQQILRREAKENNLAADDMALLAMAIKANGSIGDALTYLSRAAEDLGQIIRYKDVVKTISSVTRDQRLRITDIILNGSQARLKSVLSESVASGYDPIKIIKAISGHLLELKEIRKAPDEALGRIPERLQDKYEEQAWKISDTFTDNAVAAIGAHIQDSGEPDNPILLAEIVLSNLISIPKGNPRKADPAAPQPQPVTPEPKPEPKFPGQGQRPMNKRLASLSLKNIMSEVEQEGKTAGQALPGTPPTDDAIRYVWRTLSPEIEKLNKPRFSNAVANSTYTITEKGGVKTLTFEVGNESMRKWVEEHGLPFLTEKMRAGTRSNAVNVAVTVSPVPPQPAVKSNRDKALELMAGNEQLRHLVEDLGLETD